MPTAEARVETERPGRYLVQLCQHIAHLGDPTRRFRHRPAAPHAGERPDVSIVESSDAHAVVDFTPWGRCTMRAEPNVLTLRVEASDEENLRRLQEMLTSNLTRFGWRDHLEVAWSGSDVGPRSRRRLLLGIVLIKLGIVAAILILPSGLAISLGAGHAVALLVLLVAAVVTALVFKLRGKPLRPAPNMLRHNGR